MSGETRGLGRRRLFGAGASFHPVVRRFPCLIGGYHGKIIQFHLVAFRRGGPRPGCRRFPVPRKRGFAGERLVTRSDFSGISAAGGPAFGPAQDLPPERLRLRNRVRRVRERGSDHSMDVKQELRHARQRPEPDPGAAYRRDPANYRIRMNWCWWASGPAALFLAQRLAAAITRRDLPADAGGGAGHHPLPGRPQPSSRPTPRQDDGHTLTWTIR